ncbi:putative nuclease HARBI1 isoform X2 [Ixodes scapularis]
MLDIVDVIGKFGTYHALIVLLIMLRAVPTGWTNMITPLIAPKMDHWCARPPELLLANFSDHEWKTLAVPLTEDGSFAKCEMYLVTIGKALIDVDRNVTVACQSWEYNTSVYEKTIVNQIVVRWLCDELREEPEVRRVRTSWTVMTVELQVLGALRFYDTGSFQGMVASDEHVARDQKTVSVAVRAVSVAIVRRLGVQRGWIHFPETPSERFDAEKGFRLLGRIPGVIGCVDGTMVSIVGPSKNDPTVTKAAYWCRKYFYALNVMVVSTLMLRSQNAPQICRKKIRIADTV